MLSTTIPATGPGARSRWHIIPMPTLIDQPGAVFGLTFLVVAVAGSAGIGRGTFAGGAGGVRADHGSD